MDTISLVRNKQKEIENRFKNIRRNVKLQNIKIKENVTKRRSRKEVLGKRKFSKKTRATIYLGHIPHGFYETEMMSYFSQFGKVISASLARSDKTGRSKGFGFVEFQNEDVAKIAAETMNNYLMYNRILKCRYIPPEERKGKKLRKIDPLKNPRAKNQHRAIKKKNLAADGVNQNTYKEKAEKKIEAFRKFFQDKGIDFFLQTNDNNNTAQVCQKPEGDSDVSGCKSTSETDDQFGILEIDESDSDIHFKTPPNVKKLIKKSYENDSSVSKTEGKKVKVKKAKSNKELLKKSVRIKKNENNCGTFQQEKSKIELKKHRENLPIRKNKSNSEKMKAMKIGLKVKKLMKPEKKKNLKMKSVKKGMEELLEMKRKKVESKMSLILRSKKNSAKSIDSTKMTEERNQRKGSLRNG